MAASLVNSVRLSELIAESLENYEAIAIDLAKKPYKLKQLKKQLLQNRAITDIFNNPIFAKKIESAYIEMYERHRADLAPDDIYAN